MDIPEVIEEFYGVYLLYCLNPKFMGRTYIGYTTDPNRRINQHNKGVLYGGAKRTNNRGPWKMVLIVHGFPNNIAALRFEWAWQNPSSSRRLRHLPRLCRAPRESALQYATRILAEMLHVGPWRRLPLTIRWLSQQHCTEFKPDKLPPLHMPICHGPVKTKKVKCKKIRDEKNGDPSKSKSATNRKEQTISGLNKNNDRIVSSLSCTIKSNDERRVQNTHDGTKKFPSGNSNSNLNSNVFCCLCFKIINEGCRVSCLKTDCDLLCHLKCLAELFLEDGEYVPVEGNCPSCGCRLLWGDLIRKLKGCEVYGYDKNVEDDDGDDVETENAADDIYLEISDSD